MDDSRQLNVDCWHDQLVLTWTPEAAAEWASSCWDVPDFWQKIDSIGDAYGRMYGKAAQVRFAEVVGATVPAHVPRPLWREPPS